jgi:hypothetical protein
MPAAVTLRAGQRRSTATRDALVDDHDLSDIEMLGESGTRNGTIAPKNFAPSDRTKRAKVDHSRANGSTAHGAGSSSRAGHSADEAIVIDED